MSTKSKFWNDVIQYIESDFGTESPGQWRKPQIDSFLIHFRKQLQHRCTEDKTLIQVLGWGQPKNGQQPDGATISYDSFRRIFISKESKGNRTTRNMFAIYMGYLSYEDYYTKKSIEGISHIKNKDKSENNKKPLIKEQESLSLNNSPSDVKSKTGSRILYILPLAALFTALLLYFATTFSRPDNAASPILTNQSNPKLIFRNDNGIAIIPVSGGEPIQVISNRRYLTGIDYDPKNRYLFWSNTNSSTSYLGISRGQLDTTLSKLVPGSFRRQIISDVKYPSGIALDPNHNLLYCADYGDSTIKVFNYEGKLLEPNLIEGMNGAPSSVEIDLLNNTLYWTDVSNDRIGKFDLQTFEANPYFITNAGVYPDGLSIDTLNNRLFWASAKSMEIGMADLSTGNSKLIKVDISPAAVEISSKDQMLYFSALKSDAIRKGKVTTDSIFFFPNDQLIYTYGSLPSVLKLTH